MYAKTLFVRIMNACNRLLLVKLMSCLHDLISLQVVNIIKLLLHFI